MDESKEILIGSNQGNDFKIDILKTSNMFITGTTGSGKTSFIQSVITQIQDKYTPDEVKFVIFDSKNVDYSYMKDNPFLLLPIITDVHKLTASFAWAINLRGKINDESFEDNPHIFFIIDDFSGASYYPECSDVLTELLKMSRMLKTHVVIITSTPSSEIVKTDIKANLPYKIAFHTANRQISRMIIDDKGAENLYIPGEMIFVGDNKRIKLNSVYYDYSCIIEKNNEIIKKYPKVVQYHEETKIEDTKTDDTEEFDELFEKACYLVLDNGKASTALLQRVYKIGFNRAAKIIDQMESSGIVAPEDGTKPREVLVNEIELASILNQLKH